MHCRLDRWEAEQKQWTETANVLRHFRDSVSLVQNANTASNTTVKSATKKRKIDANNKNYIAATGLYAL